MNIADWDPESVEHWALCYGFKEKKVIENIRIFHIGGKQLLSGRVTANFIGITKPLARKMFVARIDELIRRDLEEKDRTAAIQQRKKRARLWIAEESDKEMAVPSRCVNKKAPKSIFRLQLEEEDRKVRSAKVIPSFVSFSLILISLQMSLLDDVSDGEGEEEEEEGQRGLRDFGFGTMSELREMDEEKDPLKLRRGDLDHIVDDVSDGEGEEEEEEGQRGLGDFGFRTMSELREMDEDPLKLRRGDLDHIVDDVTSDEEEGELALGDFFGLTNAAMEIEIALDKQRRKELFAALEKEKEEKRRKLRSRRRSGDNC
jgi:hypothetical protein